MATQAPAERAVQLRIEKVRSAEREEAAKVHSSLARHIKDEKQSMQKAIDDFERASGVHISTWTAGRIGEAVKFVLDGGLRNLEAQLRHIGDEAARIQKTAIGAATTYAKPK